MGRPSTRRLRRFGGGGSGSPGERDWENAPLLTPQPAGYEPALISDGGGLSFPPSVFDGPPPRLDETDAAVQALTAILARQKNRVRASGLAEWRLLARTDGEALFGHGGPEDLLTVLLRRESRGHGWRSHAVNNDATLRTVRDGIRASRWRLDPAHEPGAHDTVLRVLITEQSRAGGKRADDRLLAPDLHVGSDELVLTAYVTPRGGFHSMAVGNPETPARIALPEPLGGRPVIDGALFEHEADERG